MFVRFGKGHEKCVATGLAGQRAFTYCVTSGASSVKKNVIPGG